MHVAYPAFLASRRYSVSFRKMLKLMVRLYDDFYNYEIGNEDVEWYPEFFSVNVVQHAEDDDGNEIEESRLLEVSVGGVSVGLWIDSHEINFDNSCEEYLNAEPGDELSEANLDSWVSAAESFLVEARDVEFIASIYEEEILSDLIETNSEAG